MEKPTPTVGMTFRRGGAKLRSLGKAHSPLYILLWQARETQAAILAAAAAQKTLFNDLAAWASNENRALSDICSCASELSTLYASSQAQLSLSYKTFRKEMSMILEGERRCDSTQKKLQEAEHKRLKLRRQVLRAQSRRDSGGDNSRRSGDFTTIQTQLAEAERFAEKAHLEACDATREQEAVKLVVLKSALSKLTTSHLALVNQSKIIFESSLNISKEIPEPPPPGDPLSCIRYTAFEKTKEIVDQTKMQFSQMIQRPLLDNSTNSNSNDENSIVGSPSQSSTPIHSPRDRISTNWNRSTPEPTAPPPRNLFSPVSGGTDPPPPYNIFGNCCYDYKREQSPEHYNNNYRRESGGLIRERRSYANVNSSYGENNRNGQGQEPSSGDLHTGTLSLNRRSYSVSLVGNGNRNNSVSPMPYNYSNPNPNPSPNSNVNYNDPISNNPNYENQPRY